MYQKHTSISEHVGTTSILEKIAPAHSTDQNISFGQRGLSLPQVIYLGLGRPGHLWNQRDDRRRRGRTDYDDSHGPDDPGGVWGFSPIPRL